MLGLECHLPRNSFYVRLMLPVRFIFFLKSIHYTLAAASALPSQKHSSDWGFEKFFACQACRPLRISSFNYCRQQICMLKQILSLTEPSMAIILSQLKPFTALWFFFFFNIYSKMSMRRLIGDTA